MLAAFRLKHYLISDIDFCSCTLKCIQIPGSDKNITIKILDITLTSIVEKMHLRKFRLYNICCTGRLISKTKIAILF